MPQEGVPHTMHSAVNNDVMTCTGMSHQHAWFQTVYQASLRFCLRSQTYIQTCMKHIKMSSTLPCVTLHPNTCYVGSLHTLQSRQQFLLST